MIPMLPMSTSTSSATAWDEAGKPAWAMIVAAARFSIRFLGLIPDSSAAMPNDFTGVKVSSACIHLGSGAASPCRGRPCHCRSATMRSSTPRTSFTALAAVEGPPVSASPAAFATTSAMPPTTASPAIQPNRNASPLLRAFGVMSIRMIAMIGTGLIAMPRASGRISPITCCMGAPSEERASRCGVRLPQHIPR